MSAAYPYARLGWLLVVGTVPAGFLGLLFEDQLKLLFAAPRLVAAALIFNGLLLVGAGCRSHFCFAEAGPPPNQAGASRTIGLAEELR